jgi:hypothetical protein
LDDGLFEVEVQLQTKTANFDETIEEKKEDLDDSLSLIVG